MENFIFCVMLLSSVMLTGASYIKIITLSKELEFDPSKEFPLRKYIQF